MNPKMPVVPGLNSELYAALGDKNWQDLLLEFYTRLKKSAISHKFPQDIAYPAEKAAWFFIQISGGPDLYT
jgi:truncated hemoglobin YjbI